MSDFPITKGKTLDPLAVHLIYFWLTTTQIVRSVQQRSTWSPIGEHMRAITILTRTSNTARRSLRSGVIPWKISGSCM